MVTTTAPRSRRPNADTPARWFAALERAQARNIQVWQDRESGDFLALSSDATKVYTVRWYTCTCAAGEADDPVCVHRAAFRAHCREEDRQVARILAGPNPDPTTPAPVAIVPARLMCSDCLDSGWARISTGGHLNDYVSVACGCQAGGRAA